MTRSYCTFFQSKPSFTLLEIGFDGIAERLGAKFENNSVFSLIQNLEASQEDFAKNLLSQHPIHVAAVVGWPGRSLLWREIRPLDLEQVTDWFSFLGIPKNKGNKLH